MSRKPEPFVNAMEANFYEVHPELRQAVAFEVDDTTKTWGNAGLTPSGGDWAKDYSPMFKYEWQATWEALNRYAACTAGSPFDGVLVSFRVVRSDPNPPEKTHSDPFFDAVFGHGAWGVPGRDGRGSGPAHRRSPSFGPTIWRGSSRSDPHPRTAAGDGGGRWH